MVIVDTSVWIEAQRRPAGEDATTLRSLLDADEVALALPVRIQLLMGTAKQDRLRVRRAFSAVPLIMPTKASWQIIDRWIDTAADAGYRFSISDLLIAALTYEVTGLVWSLDKDFVAMEQLGFVRCY